MEKLDSTEMIRACELASLISDAEEERRKKIKEIPLENLHSEKASFEENPLFEKFRTRQLLETTTNFPEDIILDLYTNCLPTFEKFKRRGPKPSVSHLDSIVLLLIFYKTALDFHQLESYTGIKAATAHTTIARVRPILLETLSERWWKNRIRPSPVLLSPVTAQPQITSTHQTYPSSVSSSPTKTSPTTESALNLQTPSFSSAQSVFGMLCSSALIIETITFEVLKPTGKIEEAKVYYDSKNQIYGIKKEIAVMATPPHFALFSQKGAPASIHNSSLHKQHYHTYLEYLQKTPQERENPLLLLDSDYLSWSVLVDSSFCGADHETPGERRIFAKKDLSLSPTLTSSVSTLAPKNSTSMNNTSFPQLQLQQHPQDQLQSSGPPGSPPSPNSPNSSSSNQGASSPLSSQSQPLTNINGNPSLPNSSFMPNSCTNYSLPGSPPTTNFFTHPSCITETRLNEEICKLRVSIECFFGRLRKLWNIANTRYRLDHCHFDDDIDLSILLTNEHMRYKSLTPREYLDYRAMNFLKKEKQEERTEKRKAQKENYVQRKKSACPVNPP